MPLFIQTKFFQVSQHHSVNPDQIFFQLLNLPLHRWNIDLLFLLERIDIAGDIQVKLVIGDLFQLCPVRIFFDRFECLIGLHDFRDIFLAQPVLVFQVLEVVACVDEENIGGRLAFIKYEDRGRDPGAEKQVFGRAEDRLEQVFLDEFLPDLSFGPAPEQDAMRYDDANPPFSFANRVSMAGKIPAQPANDFS
jgi:hypothetical protein